jgi:hypothetical protein
VEERTPMTSLRIVGPAPRTSFLRLVAGAVAVLVLCALLFLGEEIRALSLQAACNLTTLVAIVSLAAVLAGAPRGLWSPSAVFLVVVVVFHCGLTSMVGLGSEARGDIALSVDLWLHRTSTRTALWLVDLALAGYAVGAFIAHTFRPRAHRHGPTDDELNTLLTVAGVVGVLLSIALWFGTTMTRGGTSLLFGSYQQFLRATEGSSLPYVYQGISLGMVLVAASRWSTWHRVALVAFVGWSLVAFPLGLRGEILFPTLAALAVVATRRAPVRPRTALVAAVALLAMIAVTRNLRNVGLGSLASADIAFSPLDGLKELGTSIRPVSEVVFWHEMGDRFDGGATYWAPVDRFLYHLVPGWTRPSADHDDRLMNNLVMKRAGPIGFSIVAEAYRNYAATGALLVLLLLGFLLGRVDTWPNARVHQCISGVVLVALLNHVRNSFVPVPTQLITGIGLVLALALLARLLARRQEREGRGMGASSPAARAPAPGRRARWRRAGRG